MNRLGKQLLTRALSSVKANSPLSSSRLYSVVNSSGTNTKWLQSFQIHQLTSRHLVMLGVPRRFQHQNASINDELNQEESEELQSESQLQQQTENQGATSAQIAEFFREHQIHVQGLQDPKIPKPIFDFGLIQLPAKLQALIEKMAFTIPTPIQAQSLPILLAERDLIGKQLFAFVLKSFIHFYFTIQELLKLVLAKLWLSCYLHSKSSSPFTQIIFPTAVKKSTARLNCLAAVAASTPKYLSWRPLESWHCKYSRWSNNFVYSKLSAFMVAVTVESRFTFSRLKAHLWWCPRRDGLRIWSMLNL